MISNKDVGYRDGVLQLNGLFIPIGGDSMLSSRVTVLEETVGDDSSGLVKDVDDLQTAVGDDSSGLVKDVDDLQTVVGDDSSGLVKDVDDLQTAVGGFFEQLTNDRINTPGTDETFTKIVMRNGAGIFNDVNGDIKYLWFVYLSDGSTSGNDLPAPVCVPYKMLKDSEYNKTNFVFSSGAAGTIEISRGDSDAKIVWSWAFGSAPAQPYRYRIFASN